jgi:hypothetical protein
MFTCALLGNFKPGIIHLSSIRHKELIMDDFRPFSNRVPSTEKHKKELFFEHRWDPFVRKSGTSSSSSVILEKTNYEWPFEFVVPGNIQESLEGKVNSYARYYLKATVKRGSLAKDKHADKKFRIIRTLSPETLETYHGMVVENLWPNKVEYTIDIPHKAVIFGSRIPINFRATPLKKGLKLGDIELVLIETREWKVRNKDKTPSDWATDKDVVKRVTYSPTERDYNDVINEGGQDGWDISTEIKLPATLGSGCLQDMESDRYKIRHKIEFAASLINPEGHTSEVSIIFNDFTIY